MPTHLAPDGGPPMSRRLLVPLLVATCFVASSCAASEDPPTNVTSESVTLNGKGWTGANDTNTYYWWQVSTDPNFGGTPFETAHVGPWDPNIGSQSSPVALLPVDVNRLKANTGYYARLCGKSDAQAAACNPPSSAKSFTTQAAPTQQCAATVSTPSGLRSALTSVPSGGHVCMQAGTYDLFAGGGDGRIKLTKAESVEPALAPGSSGRYQD